LPSDWLSLRGLGTCMPDDRYSCWNDLHVKPHDDAHWPK
jgi:hypothetical protein